MAGVGRALCAKRDERVFVLGWFGSDEGEVGEDDVLAGDADAGASGNACAAIGGPSDGDGGVGCASEGELEVDVCPFARGELYGVAWLGVVEVLGELLEIVSDEDLAGERRE